MENSEHTVKPGTTKLSDSQKEAIVGFVEYLVDTLTFRRVFLIALLGIMFIGLVSLLENRSSVFNFLLSSASSISRVEDPENTVWKLSEKSKQSLLSLTKSFPIKYVDVTEVDLKQNLRIVQFVHLENSTMSDLDKQRFFNDILKPHSVFDYDAKNTAQMVAVLANEFRCDNFTDTMYFKIAPNSAADISTVCHIAIPPFVGQFVGYLSVGVERKMSKIELDTVRLELSRIAVEIYLQDVTNQPKI